MNNNLFSHTKLNLSSESKEILKNSTIIVIGCGSVGSYTLDNLVRSGIGNITIIDNGLIEFNNYNSNAIADSKGIGKFKVDYAKKRLLKLNPELNIKVIKEYVSLNNVSKLIPENVSYVIDTISGSIRDKVAIIAECNKKHISILSSLVTSDMLDPSLLEITDIQKTKGLASINLLKSELEKNSIEHLKVIYSKEQPARFRNFNEESSFGGINFVPSIAGISICSEVLTDILN